MKDCYILKTEDGRQFRLTTKEFEQFELIFGECELVDIDTSNVKIVKTPAPWEE